MNPDGILSQLESIYTDVTSGQYGQGLIDAAPILVEIGGFVKGLGFAQGAVTQEQVDKCKDATDKVMAAIATAKKKVGASEKGKIGDGTILNALENLIKLAVELWPLIAPFIKP